MPAAHRQCILLKTFPPYKHTDTDHTPISSTRASSLASSYQQEQLQQAMERARLKEKRLMLSYQGEQRDKAMSAELKAVEEAVERARRATQELERRREEEERRRREEAEARRHEEEEKR